jgi:hypothetical protein
MPGKSKRSKGKRYQQTKKSQNIPRQDALAAPAPAAAAAPKAAPTVQKVPPVKAAAAAANAISNQYAYIPGDLQRIGILTGIIIVILVILYFILK